MTRFYSILADVVLVAHFSYVAFVVVGLALVWIGYFLRWGFVRNGRFRLAHLAAMGVVMLESVFGVTCPLTTWEMRLRLLAGGGPYSQGSFLQHWIHRILFYPADEGVFRVIYAAFFALVLLSFWIVRPQWPPGSRQGRA